MIGLILICHGDLADSLLRTAEGIVGPIAGVETVSNDGKSPEVVRQEVRDAMSSFDKPSGILIMVDLYGSSCWRSGVRIAAQQASPSLPVAVISGINLGTVLSFSQKRDILPFGRLAAAMAEDARRGIHGPRPFPEESK